MIVDIIIALFLFFYVVVPSLLYIVENYKVVRDWLLLFLGCVGLFALYLWIGQEAFAMLIGAVLSVLVLSGILMFLWRVCCGVYRCGAWLLLKLKR